MEFLNRCSSPTVDVNNKFYYPYGNTLMEDYLEDFVLDDDVNILILGSGDIRHILKTVGGFFLRSKAGITPPKTANFDVTDVDPSIVARNLILLTIIENMNSEKQEDIDYLWDVWYNKSILTKHHQRLQSVIIKLLRELSEDDDVKQDLWHLGNKESRNQIETVLRAWKYVPQIRFHEARGQHTSIKSIQSPLLYKDRTQFLVDSEFKEEYRISLETRTARNPGLDQQNPEIRNPTMFRPYQTMFCVPSDVQPWLSYFPLDSKPDAKFSSLYDAATEKLRDTIKDFLSALENTKVHITFWTEEALSFCYLTLEPQGPTYQLIHTSNLSDYLGLINVLLACQPLLKDERSVLMLEIFNWALGYPTLEMYLRENLCCDPLLVPTIFGLRLAEDFQFGTSSLHTVPTLYTLKDTCSLKTVWVKVPMHQNVIPIDLQASSDIRRVLEKILKLTIGSAGIEPDELHPEDSRHTYTPLTLFRLLRHLQHRVSGGTSALLEFVEKSRSDGSYRSSKQSMVWKMLSEILSGNQKEDKLLEMKIIFPDVKKKLTELESIKKGSSEISFPTRLVITFPEFQSLQVISIFTYDKMESAFSFLMVGPVWLLMAESAAICVISHGLSYGTARSNFLSLKGTGMILRIYSQQKVDPEKSFVRQGISCVEYTEHYELTILADNRGKKIKISEKFLPIGKMKTNELILDASYSSSYMFISVDHYLKFSCYIDRSRSKFSINSANGKITAVLIKNQDLNNGRSVLPYRKICKKLDLKKLNVSDFKAYIEETELLNTIFCSPLDLHMRVLSNGFEEINEDQFSDLRNFVLEILQSSSNVVKHWDIFISDDPKKSGLAPGIPKARIAIMNAHIYKGLPFLEVKISECETAIELVERNLLTLDEFFDTINLTFTEEQRRTENLVVFNVKISDKEYEMILKLLRINSRRMTQTKCSDLDNVWHYNSYIQALFPTEKLPHIIELQDILITEPHNERHRQIKEYGTERVAKAFPKFHRNIDELFEDSNYFLGMSSLYRNMSLKCGLGPRLPFGYLSPVGLFGGLQNFPFSPLYPNPRPRTNFPSSAAEEKCHNAKCPRQIEVKELKKCAKCRSASYCSKSCQLEDWPNHKKVCKPSGDQEKNKENFTARPRESGQDVPVTDRKGMHATFVKIMKALNKVSDSEDSLSNSSEPEEDVNIDTLFSPNTLTEIKSNSNNNNHSIPKSDASKSETASGVNIKKKSGPDISEEEQELIAAFNNLYESTEYSLESKTLITNPAKQILTKSVLKPFAVCSELNKAEIIPVVARSKPVAIRSIESKSTCTKSKEKITESKSSKVASKTDTTDSKSITTETKSDEVAVERKKVDTNLKECGMCGRVRENMKCCLQCRAVYYCSLGCQHSDWRQHRAHCRVPDT